MTNTAFHVELWDSSSNSIDITPEWGAIEGGSKIANLNRTPLGGLNIHTFSAFRTWRFKYILFPSSAAAVINSWYDSRELCVLQITDPGSLFQETAIFSVQIINKSSPFEEYNNKEAIYHRGKIDLTVY